MSKSRLTSGTLALLQQWVAKEYCEAADNVRYYSQHQQVEGERGEAILIEPNPQQVEVWTQKRAMLEGVASALDELAEKREMLFQINEIFKKFNIKVWDK